MPQILSNTWPPSSQDALGLIRSALASAGPLQTTWPPRSNTQNLLTGLASDALHARLLRMDFDNNAGSPIALRARPGPPRLPRELDDEAVALFMKSRDVLGHLVSSDFWQRMEIQVDVSAPWATGGPVPGFSVTISDPAGTLTTHVQPAHPHADLAREVIATTVIPSKLKDVLIQAPAPELCLLRKFQDIRAAAFDGSQPDYPWTCWVVDATIDVLAGASHRLKHAIRLPRPFDTEFDYIRVPTERPLIDPAPAYTAYPGGHASLMAALTVVLSKVCRCSSAETTQLEAYALSIARNREAAGLHTKLDTDAGWQFGLALGAAMVAAATRQHTANGIQVYTYLPWAAAYQSAEGEWK